MMMAYVIKAEVVDPRAKTFEFIAQKTMYGGKLIAKGDIAFVFASENEGGQGLVARGIVIATNGARQEADGAPRAQTFFRLG
jgi:hypothetical protein